MSASDDSSALSPVWCRQTGRSTTNHHSLGAVSREPHPEVPVPRQFPRARLRSTAAVFTTMSALAATSLGHRPLGRRARSRRALRPDAHRRPPLRGPGHLERRLSTPGPGPGRGHGLPVLPGRPPADHAAELTADHFPATTRFFEQRLLRPLHPAPAPAAALDPDAAAVHGVRHTARLERRATGPPICGTRSPRPTRRSTSRATTSSTSSPTRTRPAWTPTRRRSSTSTRPLRADGTDLRRVVTVFEQHPPDRLVLAHETGHVFDLPDLYHRPRTARATGTPTSATGT